MGSIAVTTGTVRVHDRPEVQAVLKDLDELAEGMDERRVESRKANRRKYGPGVLEVDICISGYASGTHAGEIDDKIRELGPYAVEAARFVTEWECERGVFFVGNKEQVPKAESASRRSPTSAARSGSCIRARCFSLRRCGAQSSFSRTQLARP